LSIAWFPRAGLVFYGIACAFPRRFERIAATEQNRPSLVMAWKARKTPPRREGKPGKNTRFHFSRAAAFPKILELHKMAQSMLVSAWTERAASQHAFRSLPHRVLLFINGRQGIEARRAPMRGARIQA